MQKGSESNLCELPAKHSLVESTSLHKLLGQTPSQIKSVAFELEFHKGRHKVDGFSLSNAFSVCVEVAAIRQGEMIYSLAVKTGYVADMSVSGSLVDMYAKNGNLVASERVFSLVTRPNVKCWNTMLGGYGYHANNSKIQWGKGEGQGLAPLVHDKGYARSNVSVTASAAFADPT